MNAPARYIIGVDPAFGPDRMAALFLPAETSRELARKLAELTPPLPPGFHWRDEVASTTTATGVRITVTRTLVENT